MKKVLLVQLGLISILFAYAQMATRYLRITQTDGTKTLFAVNTIDSIDFVTASELNLEDTIQVVGLVGQLQELPNPCTTIPCMPGLDLALCTEEHVFYIRNAYEYCGHISIDTDNDEVADTHIMQFRLLGKTFYENENVVVNGVILSEKDVNNKAYYTIQISEIMLQ